MKRVTVSIGAALLVALSALKVSAQDTATPTPTSTTATQTTTAQGAGETRVPLTEPSVALDAAGRVALAGRLRVAPAALAGTNTAPVRDIKVLIENRSQNFYIYVSGLATFYDAEGVRCGGGLFKIDALAVNESAETDAPGLRLTCAPATWRIAATTLLTRSSDVAKSNESAPATATPGVAQPTAALAPATTTALPLMIDINGRTLPLQLGNPLEIKVGAERMRIVVRAAP